MSQSAFCVIAISVTLLLATVIAKENRLFRKFPLKLYTSSYDPVASSCDSPFGGFESCENHVSSSMLQKLYPENNDYGSDEATLKYFGDDIIREGKRNHDTQTGCNCQLRSNYIDLGPFTYPRYVKNVTCDEHHRCFRARSKAFSCNPIHYKVNVITLRDEEIDENDDAIEPYLPQKLRCCWKSSIKQMVVGCICGPLN